MNKESNPISIMVGPDFYAEVGERKLRQYFKYLSHGSHHIGHETDIVYRLDGNIIGVAGIWPNPFDDAILWLPFLSVHTDYKRRGVGTALARAAAEYAKEKDKTLSLSEYSGEGNWYLSPVIRRLINEGYRIKHRMRST